MSWEGDTLLLGQGRRGIWRVAAGGGTPELLFQVNDGEEAYGPRALPDGAVLYTIATGIEWLRWDEARIVVHVPGQSTPTTVHKAARTHGICRPPGIWCSRAAACCWPPDSTCGAGASWLRRCR